MGFISSSSTVTVRANLTDAGRAKLYSSIEQTNAPFATKFSLGDSDANYESIAGGFGTLATGHIPEPSTFAPRIKSWVLASGTYRPFSPNIKLMGSYSSEVFAKMAISVGEPSTMTLELKTAWPLGTVYGDTYDIYVQGPDSIISSKAITDFVTVVVNTGANQVSSMVITVLVKTQYEFDMLFGENTSRNATATVAIKVRGKSSGAISILYLDLTEF